MKHLSCKKNFGYKVQPVFLKDIIYLNPQRGLSPKNPVYLNIFDEEKLKIDLICEQNNPIRNKRLAKSIDEEGLFYPIPVWNNVFEKRLQFFGGHLRMKYAAAKGYESIDAIVLKDKAELSKILDKMGTCGLRKRIGIDDL